MSENAASASSFIASVGDSAAEIDSATKEAEAHGESVAKAGRPSPCSRKAQVALRGAAAAGRRRGSAARTNGCPAASRSKSQTPRGAITTPVYEISTEGILIGGPDAERLPQRSFNATLQDIGACRIRIGEQSKAGTQAQFERQVRP